MTKYHWISAGLSLLAIVLLPIHSALVARVGGAGWLDLAFGLPIGLIVAFDIDIIANKIHAKTHH